MGLRGDDTDFSPFALPPRGERGSKVERMLLEFGVDDFIDFLHEDLGGPMLVVFGSDGLVNGE